MRETKISIVVPVYNAEKELQRCVDSIFRQSFSDWELLLIDDGSSDSSPALCDRLAQRDPRIRVYHKENGGVSSARNLGICEAQGTYLVFADSDDTLFPDALETLHRKAQETDADYLVCGFTYLVEQNGKCVDNFPEKAFCGGGKEYLEERFLSDFRRELFNPPWNKLIRRELLLKNDIRFRKEFAICEDMAFSMQVMEKCTGICVIPETLYCYHYKEADNLVNRFHENYYEALLYFRDRALQCFRTLHAKPELYEEINDYFVGKSLMFLHKIYRDSGYEETKKYAELQRIGGSASLQSALREYRVFRISGKRRLLRELLLRRKFRLLDSLYRWR